ncbi:putative Cystatin domain-containing protein [Dioscorea sansibarensis]
MQDAHLEFESVVKSKIEPLVEGVIYYITLEASNVGLKQLYQAKVWVKESTNYKELLSFEHVVKNST